MELEQYILACCDPEPEYLYRLNREANLRLLHGRMTSGHLQGRLLKMFVQMIKPRNILEVGTFAGYSALCLAEGLESGGKVYTFEINDELEDFTRSWINGSEFGQRVEFIIGDALQLAPKLGLKFDLVFIDGDKRNYIEAYEMAMTILNPGGFILADNTLWDSHVVDQNYIKDQQTQGIIKFNEYIKQDRRVEQVLLPLRDGLTIIRSLIR